ncbi:MAG: hypothetical protein HY286_11990 [Planctomycetes bacterium]|nr:hypothetical protein [Planctomycetota bacterium]
MQSGNRIRSVVLPVLLNLIFAAACAAPARKDGPYLAAARDIGRWLRSAAVEDANGLRWAADPEDPKTAGDSLYSGTAGIALFFVELYESTGEREYLTIARRAADAMAAALPARASGEGAGLYTGVAGEGVAFLEVFAATGDESYKRAAERAVDLIVQSLDDDKAGIVNDIIAGRAGIGLFLIYANARLNDTKTLPAAETAAKSLLSRAHRAKTGSWWDIEPSYKRNMPNFSHGTAGVAFFLARLYQNMNRKEYLDAALAGAQYIESAADISDDGFRLFHADPDGLDRYYLGYCHGPAGTARLFYLLNDITGDNRWRNIASKCSWTILRSGIPAARTTGFWNNVSQCCGSAGIGEFLMYASGGDKRGPEESKARVLADDLLHRGLRDARGLRFPQAEHRIKPDLILAQTGFAQGAAGIGLFLLHLDAADRGRAPRVVLPDAFGSWR